MKWREYSLQATPLMRRHCVLCIAVRCACVAICARSLTSKLADALRLIIGEPRSEFELRKACGGIFSRAEYIRALRLTSKLVDLQAGYANSILHKMCKRRVFVLTTTKKEQTTTWDVCSFLVEVAGKQVRNS